MIAFNTQNLLITWKGDNGLKFCKPCIKDLGLELFEELLNTCSTFRLDIDCKAYKKMH